MRAFLAVLLLASAAHADAWSPRKLAQVPSIAGESAVIPLAAPFIGSRWVVTGTAEEKTVRLALLTAAGWFVGTPAGDPGLAVHPVSIESHDGVVTARVITTWNDGESGSRWQMHCQESLVVCGVGPSATPSCLPAIADRDGTCEDPDQAVEWDFTLEVKVTPKAVLVTAPKGKKLTTPARGALGKHPLSFQ